MKQKLQIADWIGVGATIVALWLGMSEILKNFRADHV